LHARGWLLLQFENIYFQKFIFYFCNNFHLIFKDSLQRNMSNSELSSEMTYLYRSILNLMDAHRFFENVFVNHSLEMSFVGFNLSVSIKIIRSVLGIELSQTFFALQKYLFKIKN